MEQSDPVTIRPVTAADVDPLAALQEASILRLGMAPYGAAKVRAWARVGHEFKHVLLEEGRYFVAERAGERVGVGGWSPDSLEAELAWIRYLFVHPDHVRCGIGRRLVEVAERAAAAAGRPRFEVWSSLNAVPFYTALGYRRVRAARWPVAAEIALDYVLMGKPAARPDTGSASRAASLSPG
jgi:GNAT superfamily N-acetyltransferase